MSEQASLTDEFKQKLRESLNSRAVKIVRPASVYTCGDNDEMVY